MLAIIPRGVYVLDTELGRWGRISKDTTVLLCIIPEDKSIAVFRLNNREYSVYVSQCRRYNNKKG